MSYRMYTAGVKHAGVFLSKAEAMKNNKGGREVDGEEAQEARVGTH